MGEIEKWTSKMKPQGTERYFVIDQHLGRYGRAMRDQKWTKAGKNPTYSVSFHRGGEFVMKPGDLRYESLQTNVAVYGDKMYVVQDGYLCVTAMGETQNQGRVLGQANISTHKMTPLVANDYGIFVVDGDERTFEDRNETQILWYTHEGSILKRIIIKGEVQETYICGKLLFYLKEVNGSMGCSAYWMDMETEEEHCIFHAKREKHGEKFLREAFVEYIFGNERGVVLLIGFIYEKEMDFCLEQCGWYYYDFSEPDKLSCLSNSKNGPHIIYDKPESYMQWIEKCLEKYDYDPYYINIMALDMEKNLMWVSQKPNGDGPWEPMNITRDLQKRKRPDLPIWDLSESIETLKESEKIYFDGKRCYTYTADYFCSIDAKGKIERWPVRKGNSPDFMILGDRVRIIKEPENSDERYDSQDIPFHYFPASHEFQYVLCKDKNAWPHCLYDISWMITEYEEKQKATDKCQEQEQEKQADWGDILAESDDEDAMVSVDCKSATHLEYWEGFSNFSESFGLNSAMKMAKLAERTWQALRMKPSFLRIECSFSVRKNSIRAAFIVEGHPEVFTQAESARGEIDRELQGYDVTWDGKSSAANISLTTSREGMSTSEQYKWFCRAAEALYDAVRPRLDI